MLDIYSFNIRMLDRKTLISYIHMKRNWLDIMGAREAMTRHAIQLCSVTFNIFWITKRPADFRVPFAATNRLIIDASSTSIGRYRKLRENGPACPASRLQYLRVIREQFSLSFLSFSVSLWIGGNLKISSLSSAFYHRINKFITFHKF